MAPSIGDLIRHSAVKYFDKTALIVDGRRYTFTEIDTLSSNVAAHLVRRGLEPGTRVSLYSPNCAEWIIAYYGILKAGCVANPLNLMLTASEALYAIRDCQAAAVFGQLDKLAALREQSDSAGPSLISFQGPSGGIEGFEAWIATPPEPMTDRCLVAPDAVGTIAYTSGTTGNPKGAVLSHRSILLNTAMTATFHVRTAQDTVVSALPLSHVYGNIVMNSAIAYGMTLVLHSTFKPEDILGSIQQHRATLFEGVPTMYMYLLDFPQLADYDLSSLTRCTVGGQTMPLAKMEQVEARLGVPLLELWGMTELGGLGTTHCLHGPRRLGSIGIPLPFMQARVVGPGSASPLGPDEVGELVLKGLLTMEGYLNAPDATAETIDAEGWLHTGDLAYIDGDGFIYIVDRLKDMIITGGYNIYPAELERVLCAHPAVAMAAVVGVPDPTKGELAKAFVVIARGMSVTQDELLDFCRTHLANYKVPRMVQFVDDLPKTASGKILRRHLKRS